MKTAIIIVNYNAQDLIIRCLSTLKEHLTTPYKVYITDNSLEPNTSKLEKEFSDAVILRSGVNGGFAAGCNIGLKRALKDKMDVFLLLNPDTFVEEDFLSPLLNIFKNSTQFGVLGPKILRADNRDIWEAGSKMIWWKGGPRHIYDDSLNSTDKVATVPFVSGCVMLIGKKVLETVGFLDERYFLYFEDTDYAQAIQKQGFSVGYVPWSTVYHEESSTTGYQSPSFVYYFSRNRIWFMHRWATKYHFIVFLTYTTFIKLPGSIIIFGILRRKPSLALAFIKGYIDGLRYIF